MESPHTIKGMKSAHRWMFALSAFFGKLLLDNSPPLALSASALGDWTTWSRSLHESMPAYLQHFGWLAWSVLWIAGLVLYSEMFIPILLRFKCHEKALVEATLSNKDTTDQRQAKPACGIPPGKPSGSVKNGRSWRKGRRRRG